MKNTVEEVQPSRDNFSDDYSINFKFVCLVINISINISLMCKKFQICLIILSYCNVFLHFFFRLINLSNF